MELFLSSEEYQDFYEPRKILEYQKSEIDGKDVLIVKIDTPLIGQKYGFGGDDITRLYLINRIDVNAFEKLNKFPINVHVAIPKIKSILIPASFNELQNIAWADLYDNREDAMNHKSK